MAELSVEKGYFDEEIVKCLKGLETPFIVVDSTKKGYQSDAVVSNLEKLEIPYKEGRCINDQWYCMEHIPEQGNFHSQEINALLQ